MVNNTNKGGESTHHLSLRTFSVFQKVKQSHALGLDYFICVHNSEQWQEIAAADGLSAVPPRNDRQKEIHRHFEVRYKSFIKPV